MKLIFIFLLLVFFVACSSKHKDSFDPNVGSGLLVVDSTRVKDSVMILINEKLKEFDTLFRTREDIKLYARLNSGEILSVRSEDSWPQDIVVVYNLLVDTLNNPLVLKEIPVSMSGDDDITYSYYFDNNGVVFFISIHAKFFNDNCSHTVIDEFRRYSYWKGKVLDSTYNLSTDNGRVKLNKAECEYGLPLSFKGYKDFRDTPLVNLL